MYCKMYPPVPLLRGIVDGILFVKDEHMTDFLPKENWLPTATSMIVLNFGSTYRKYKTEHTVKFDTISKSHLIGTRDMVEFISMHGFIDMIAIHFKPGGLYTLLQIPMNELNNQIVEADLLIKYFCAELEDKVLQAKSEPEKVAVIEQVLIKKLAGKINSNGFASSLTGHIIATKSKTSVKDLAHQLNLNYKSLERKSSAIIGITPKRLTAVIRFYQVLKSVMHTGHIDWKQVATECGYYDQAHLINDFKKYTNLPPDDFIKKQLAFTKLITDTVKLPDFYTQEQ